MNNLPLRLVIIALSLSILHVPAAIAAHEPANDKIEVRAYVNDTCIIADEPYFIPVTANKQALLYVNMKLARKAGVVFQSWLLKRAHIVQ